VLDPANYGQNEEAGGVEGDIFWCHGHYFVREAQGIGDYVREKTVASRRFDQWVSASTPKTL